MDDPKLVPAELYVDKVNVTVPLDADGICAPRDVDGENVTEVLVEFDRSVPDWLPNFHVSVFLLPLVLCVMEIVYDDPIVIEDVTDIVSFVPDTGQACIVTVPESETLY